jgi:RNA polymerase sigma factor (sigma-70 family)
MDEQELTRVLLVWQEQSDEPSLKAVIDARLRMIEKVAAGTLVHHHIHDSGAIDEVVSRVLEHLRRLPRDNPGDVRVSQFTPRDQNPAAADMYLRWLTKRRAVDVATELRRRWRHIKSFTGLTIDDLASDLPERVLSLTATQPAHSEAQVRILHAAIAQLNLRQRQLVQFILDGRPQVAIACELGVSEAWVSRAKQRIISKLRKTCTTEHR